MDCYRVVVACPKLGFVVVQHSSMKEDDGSWRRDVAIMPFCEPEHVLRASQIAKEHSLNFGDVVSIRPVPAKVSTAGEVGSTAPTWRMVDLFPKESS